MVHRHRPLGDRVKRILLVIAKALFERLVPPRQWIEVARDTCAMRFGRLDGAVALGSQPEFLQWLEIELENDGIRPADKAEGRCPFEIVAIGMAIILHMIGQFVKPMAAILDIALKLLRIGLAAAMKHAFLAAP